MEDHVPPTDLWLFAGSQATTVTTTLSIVTTLVQSLPIVVNNFSTAITFSTVNTLSTITTLGTVTTFSKVTIVSTVTGNTSAISVPKHIPKSEVKTQNHLQKWNNAM